MGDYHCTCGSGSSKEIQRLQSELTAARDEAEKLRGRVSELEKDRDQWSSQVGRICATLPVSKIADSTMTIGKLVDYFKDLHRENERLRTQANAIEKDERDE